MREHRMTHDLYCSFLPLRMTRSTLTVMTSFFYLLRSYCLFYRHRIMHMVVLSSCSTNDASTLLLCK